MSENKTWPLPDPDIYQQAANARPYVPDNHADLIARLKGRAAWYHDAHPGAVKTPDLLLEAAAALARTALTDREKRLEVALLDLQGSGNSTGTWMDAVTPLIARFTTAAQFNADAVHNGTGAQAIADLFKAMATRLDRAVEIARTALATNTPETGIKP